MIIEAKQNSEVADIFEVNGTYNSGKSRKRWCYRNQRGSFNSEEFFTHNLAVKAAFEAGFGAVRLENGVVIKNLSIASENKNDDNL